MSFWLQNAGALCRARFASTIAVTLPARLLATPPIVNTAGGARLALAMPGPSVITVRRTFSASAEQVFDAWLDPELVPRWMFHPSLGDQRVETVSIDARHGGAFCFEVSRSTGTQIYYGTYIEFDRPHALAFTWIDNAIGIETTVRLSFRAIGDCCEVTLRHDLGAVSDSIAERAAKTWDSELRCLSKMLN